MTIIFSLFYSANIFAEVPPTQEIKLAKDEQSCQKSSDCSFVGPNCGECHCGFYVNKKGVAKLNSELRKATECGPGITEDTPGCDPDCPLGIDDGLVVGCVDGHCQATERWHCGCRATTRSGSVGPLPEVDGMEAIATALTALNRSDEVMRRAASTRYWLSEVRHQVEGINAQEAEVRGVEENNHGPEGENRAAERPPSRVADKRTQ